MARSDNDDVADALAKLAGGEVAPSEQVPPPAPVDNAESQPAPPSKPCAFRQAMARGAARQPAAAARPQRPNTPAPRPAAPGTAPPPPPQTPDDSLSAAVTDLSAEDAAEQPVILDDDDAVIMPAPDAAVFAPRAGQAAQPPRGAFQRSALYQTIEFRRTIIPILLTCGGLMIGFGSLKYVMGEDSPLSELPVWLPVLLFVTGALLLGLAVANMLSVKHQLAAVKR